MKEEVLTDEAIKEKYIAFHSDPANIQFNDAYFCSINSISLDHLRDVIKEFPAEIAKAVKGREVTDNELSTLLGLLTRLCYEKAFKDKIKPKSLEGLVNAIVALMKQRGLESGKPTEIIEFKELEKKTPNELHTYVMSMIRRPFADRN